MRASSDTHMTPFPTTRLLPRYPVDLPVQVVFHHGAEKLVVPERGTDLSRNGMALYAGLILKAGDPIEVEFQVPSRLRVAPLAPRTHIRGHPARPMG